MMLRDLLVYRALPECFTQGLQHGEEGMTQQIASQQCTELVNVLLAVSCMSTSRRFPSPFESTLRRSSPCCGC